MRTLWTIYTKILIGVILAVLIGAGGVNYYTKTQSDAKYYAKTQADTTFVKVADLVTPTSFDTLNITNKATVPTMAAGTSTTDAANTSFVKVDRYQFVVGTTANSPTAGDSLFNFSQLIGKSVKLIRNGAIQYLNIGSANAKNGFRYDNTIGYLAVKPVWASAELVQIELFNNALVDNTMPVLQNLIKYSEDISNGAWSVVNGTVLTNQYADLTGALTLDKVTFTDNADQIRYLDGGNQVDVTENTQYRISFDCQKGTTTDLILQIYDGATYFATYNYWPLLGSGTTRVNYTFTTPAGVTNIRPILSRNSLQSGKYAFFGRIQIDKISSNYVKTTSAIIP